MRKIALVVGFSVTTVGIVLREFFHHLRSEFIDAWWKYPPGIDEAPRNTLAGPMISQELWLFGALGGALIIAGPFLVLLDWVLQRR